MLGDFRKKLHVVYGPTGCGKTSMAIEFAKENDGELVNADSRQIYKFMDIGTNKEVQKLKIIDDNYFIDDVPIHLIDIVTPDKLYSVAEYQKAAYEVMNEIWEKGKTPILVGGTGLYINSIIYSYDLSNEDFDPNLRDELNAMQTEDLQNRLRELSLDSFSRLNESDSKNPRRLIRAIEREMTKSDSSNEIQKSSFLDDSTQIEMHQPAYIKDELFERINSRVIQMVEEGLIEETKSLYERGYDFNLPAMMTMGYREAGQYIRGEVSYDEMVELIQIAHRNYAKRQMTWFRKFMK